MNELKELLKVAPYAKAKTMVKTKTSEGFNPSEELADVLYLNGVRLKVLKLINCYIVTIEKGTKKETTSVSTVHSVISFANEKVKNF